MYESMPHYSTDKYRFGDEHLLATDLVRRELGFTLPEEAHEAGAAIIGGLLHPDTAPEVLQAAWAEYAIIIEEAVDAAPDRLTAQIGASIDKATIFDSAGNKVRYLSELDAANIHAYNAGLDDVSRLLSAEIDTVAETLEPSAELMIIRLRAHVSNANREYLRELISDGVDTEDLIGDAYGMILAEGGDPDEVLKSIGMIK